MRLFKGKKDNNLYVLTTIFNPEGYKSRYKLYKEFEDRILDSGAKLIVVEAAYKDRDFEVKKRSSDHYIIRVRTDDKIWIKENLINIGLQRMNQLFPKWRYVAMIDADILFTRPNWVDETKRLLGHYPIIQMFSNLIHLNSNYQPIPGFPVSFMEGWLQGLAWKNKQPSKEDPKKVRYGWCGQPGGAWAATRECIDKIFPLYDWGILGSGDFHMANALVGYIDFTLTMDYTEEYRKSLYDWQEKVRWLRGKVGHMKGLVIHYWHGKLTDRGYETRWMLLVKHMFNPYTDLVKNKDGVYNLDKKKYRLLRDVEQYFSSRKEDEL